MTSRGADARTPWLSHGGGVRRGWASHFSIRSPRSTNHTGVQPIQGPSGFCREESRAIKTPSKPHDNVIKIHQNPSESMRISLLVMAVHQNPSKSIRIHQNPSKSIRIHQNRSESIKIDQNPSTSTKCCPSKSIKIHGDFWEPWFAGHRFSNLQNCEPLLSHQFCHRKNSSLPEGIALGLYWAASGW